ncbi:MAG: hypothetical protein KAT74_00265, partial [Candidatus Cloacimonetes bacterium]|nr:hypothetical protein [Candidatus Cloacimonadota bacterium]
MKVLFIQIALLLFLNCLYSAILEVNQDGSTPYQTIQSAIDAAVNGDTVLVYCGEYIENINITNKTICLTSLYGFIQDDNLISNTIINGNRNGSCVIIDNSDNVIINGFTITNGGYVLPDSPCWGGGLFISYSEVTIKFCVIHDNRGKVGGGLCIDHSNVNFIGNTIRHNIGNIVGGGFHALGGSQIIFDEENLNNIYCNLGGEGSDLSFTGTIPATIVVIDTFTVQNPDFFYIQRQDSLTILINNHKIELIDDDLYVAPTGDNDNSGLTQDDPLQTIAYAQMIIKSDSLSNNKIFLEDGVYSFSLNNQVYPLNVKNYVTIIGESRENTILDAEDFNPFCYQ